MNRPARELSGLFLYAAVWGENGMKLLIMLGEMSERRFRSLEGAQVFLSSCFSAFPEGGVRFMAASDANLSSLAPEETEVLTDDPETAAALGRAGICTVGFEHDGVRLPGVREIITSPEGITPAYLQTVYARFHHLPVNVISTSRLIMRESLPGDFDALWEIQREAGRDALADPVSSDRLEEQEKFSAYIDTAYPVFGFGLWTVLRKDGVIIGRCGLSPVADEQSPEGRIELGYLIGRAYRRQGYAFEACSGIISYAFDELRCPMLWCSIAPENAASIRLACKLRFREAGEKREAGILRKLYVLNPLFLFTPSEFQ